jgi:hypothetical protein
MKHITIAPEYDIKKLEYEILDIQSRMKLTQNDKRWQELLQIRNEKLEQITDLKKQLF